jgi:hypothetical protein
METSLSLDNAVVNATVLRTMSPIWRKIFLSIGIIIAVFGMRVIFPLLIVAIAGRVGPVDALSIAIQEPQRYEQIIKSAHVGISGFGGVFLLLVGFSFFFDSDKEVHWFGRLERIFGRLGGVAVMPYIVAAVGTGLLSLLIGQEVQTFLLAAASGLATFFAVKWLGDKMEVPEDTQNSVARAGFGAFLYLELLQPMMAHPAPLQE